MRKNHKLHINDSNARRDMEKQNFPPEYAESSTIESGTDMSHEREVQSLPSNSSALPDDPTLKGDGGTNQHGEYQGCAPSSTGPPRGRRGRSKKVSKDLCQICGDYAAGFHCGAFVCEPCKVIHI